METNPENQSLHQARRWPYAFGLVVCVLWPLALELLLTRLPQGEPSDPAAVQTLGHTFTGLTFLAAAYVFWRIRRAKGALAGQSLPSRIASLRRETLLASIIFGACSLLGPLYFGAAGSSGTRHARSYIAVVPVMFFAFSPRVRNWVP
ncbi:hypothetical protein [Holophaga foetida]|uniref:hypothetical protein n=1 Tax=Holophaga foetida TaxID=35839 RepID=UPI00024749AA|nr:hypothetical protein [Holophaga foetida]